MTGRRGFGGTWWGRAWIDALEQRARLDPNRLPRGRTYARRGSVGPLAVSPGEIRASVQGSRVQPYTVTIRVRVFDDQEWDRVLDAIAAKAAHTAALLDGELAPEIVADAAEVGVDLLPAAGEVGPRCSCPDWADPCKHAAAVVYLVADLFDEDPFALMVLRGRTRDQVLAALRRRRTTRGALGRPTIEGQGTLRGGALGVDPGVEARRLWSLAPTTRPSLPAVPSAPRRPGDPASLAVDPPPSSGVRRDDLTELAADAAERAWFLCLGEGDGGLRLDEDLDLVRLAARAMRSPTWSRRLTEMAKRAGVPAAGLSHQAVAWARGGADGLDVISDAWSPPPELLDEGRIAMSSLWAVRVSGNRLTSGAAGVQLRLSRAGVWYRLEKAGGRWELAGGPEADPVRALRPGRQPQG